MATSVSAVKQRPEIYVPDTATPLPEKKRPPIPSNSLPKKAGDAESTSPFCLLNIEKRLDDIKIDAAR